MKVIAASLLIAWVLGTTAVAAAADRVGDFVNAYLKKKQVPGCALMVRHNGKVVLAAGYGFANLEHNVPVTPQTVFNPARSANNSLRWP
jgi:CubicO group peptidase (beta-lactamase class C family)